MSEIKIGPIPEGPVTLRFGTLGQSRLSLDKREQIIRGLYEIYKEIKATGGKWFDGGKG